ncbi:MAG: hypothetical protein V8S57_03440 [Oscillospiraceae bacterium]
MKKTKKILVRSVLVLRGARGAVRVRMVRVVHRSVLSGQSFGDRMRANAPDDAGSFQLERVKIPVDFDELQAMNPDIYAWVTIPDTDISYARAPARCGGRSGVLLQAQRKRRLLQRRQHLQPARATTRGRTLSTP